jgi:GNAT superfamily N-acetyltransferase
MADLVARDVSDPGPLWADFFEACGPYVMYDAYGWVEPPRGLRGNERVFAFYDAIPERGGVRVAWSGVSEYPKEPGHYELAVGVWPEHQGKGYRRQVLDETARVMFVPGSMEDPAARQLTMLVFDTCQKHAAQCLRDADRGSAWVYAGRIWYPDAMRAFALTREAWESERRRD